MNSLLYAKLAKTNLSKNRQNILPYWLSCIGTVIMFYIMSTLSLSEGLKKMMGKATIQIVMQFGVYIIGLFAVIFLIYSNSFLAKRRKKEFGLFQILGMEKKHLAKVLFFESLYLWILSVGGGILLGILCYKLLFLVLLKLTRFQGTIHFAFHWKATGNTVVLFAVIFLINYLKSLHQIHAAQPIELLHGEQEGEREPKTKLLTAWIGLICLGLGYYLALTCQNPMEALGKFFGAVLLVMAGTYCLFSAGSIALLKLLKSNKRYYYQTRHFTSISGMLYRMKQNAAGLASICIMSTAVLLIVSTTACLYFGMDDLLRTRFPRNIQVTADNVTDGEIEELESLVLETVEKCGVSVRNNEENYRYRSFFAQEKGKSFTYDPEGVFGTATELYCLTLEDFNRITGQQLALAPDEILYDSVYGRSEEKLQGSVTIQGKEWKVRGLVTGLDSVSAQRVMMGSIYYLIFPDQAAIQEVTREFVPDGTWEYFLGVDLDGDSEKQAEMTAELSALLAEKDWGSHTYVEGAAASRENFYAIYGGLFFVGIFLGVLFLMATVLIIYYKQVSEGYEDHDRFVIMQKVGMDKSEVRRTINSQVRMVFLLPVLAAGVHMIFAYPMMSRILLLLNLGNQKIFLTGVFLTFLIFLVFYALVYFFTARTYYRLVRW